MILDGKMVRNHLLDNYKKIIEEDHLQITLAIIYIGNDEASKVYINNKIKYCEMVGIKTELINFKDDVLENVVINKIKELNNDKNITGIIVQSPIPKGLDFHKIVEEIDPNKDVDGFTKENWYKLSHKERGLRPATAKGIICLLKEYNIDLKGKNVCIIGRGELVGKPLIFEMLNQDATVCVCHRYTKDLAKHTKDADIIVCAAGCKRLLTEDMVSNDAIVIDVGISFEDGHIVGDVDYDNVQNKCSYITPNPGGVGPMTIAMIIDNLIEIKRGE